MTLEFFKVFLFIGFFVSSLMLVIVYSIPAEVDFNNAIYKERCKHTAYSYCGGVYLAGGER